MQQKEIGWKTSFVLFSFYLCFLIFLTSCDTSKPDPPDPPPVDPSDMVGDISDKLAARIYFDASVSMQGFVVPSSTQYKNILRPLESVITSGWKNGNTEFFRFGEQVRPIDRDSYLRTGSVDFYDDLRTYIQNIFEYEDQLVGENIDINNTLEDSIDKDTPSNDINISREENRLVVIVTDLFQDRRDVNLLVSQLKDKYIKNGLEVGLIGLRSEFNGKVYNLGTTPILYRSTPDNPETFRPFYLLVLGRHADISHYFDGIIANGFPEAQTIIFSRYLVSPLLSFEDATIDKLENLNRDTIAKKSDPRVKEYRITDKNKPSQISAKLKFMLLPHVMPFDSDTLDDLITVKHSSNGTPDVTQKAKNCLKVTSPLLQNDDSNELSIGFTLDSQSLPRKRIYLYEVTLRPGVDKFKEPEWCSEWDMGDKRNGAKTLNLVNFVRDLTQVTVRMHQPIIAKFHFYIEKR